MIHLSTFLAYLGPEAMLPMTSVLAGAVGVFMMFGRRAWGVLAIMVRNVLPRKESRPRSPERPRRIGRGPINRVPFGASRERVRG